MCVSAQSDPRVRRLISGGMLFLVLSFAMQMLKQPLRLFPAPVEFLQGVFLGICLVMGMRAVLLVGRIRRRG